ARSNLARPRRRPRPPALPRRSAASPTQPVRRSLILWKDDPRSTPSTLPACAAKQVISSPWGAPLLGLPKPVADSHAKDAPRQIPSNFRTSPGYWGPHIGFYGGVNYGFGY